MMRPAAHEATDYASDLARLSRMLRRVLTDKELAKSKKERMEEHLRALIALFSGVS